MNRIGQRNNLLPWVRMFPRKQRFPIADTLNFFRCAANSCKAVRNKGHIVTERGPTHLRGHDVLGYNIKQWASIECCQCEDHCYCSTVLHVREGMIDCHEQLRSYTLYPNVHASGKWTALIFPLSLQENRLQS